MTRRQNPTDEDFAQQFLCGLMVNSALAAPSWVLLLAPDLAAVAVLSWFYGAVSELDKRPGVVSHRYLEKGSDTERRAQEALVRLLRGYQPLTDIIRWGLASLFDPDSSNDRQLEFVNRRSGPQKMTATLALEIARHVAEQYVKDGSSIEAALAAARDRYGVSMRTVARAWAENKDGPLIRGLLHGDHTIN